MFHSKVNLIHFQDVSGVKTMTGKTSGTIVITGNNEKFSVNSV